MDRIPAEPGTRFGIGYVAREPQELYPAEAIAAAAGARAKLAVIPDGDHFYNGVEDAFARAVCGWFEAAVAAGLPAR